MVESIAGPERQHVVAHAHRHHDLFQRGIAGALADAVDGAFDLPRARLHAGERIGDRHAEIVVAMHREHRLVGIRHASRAPFRNISKYSSGIV